MSNRKTFGEILQEKRKEKGWSQVHLGKLAGIHQALITLYERDIVTPSYLVVANLADVFNCSMDDIIGRSFEQKIDKVKIKQILKELIEEIDKL